VQELCDKAMSTGNERCVLRNFLLSASTPVSTSYHFQPHLDACFFARTYRPRGDSARFAVANRPQKGQREGCGSARETLQSIPGTSRFLALWRLETRGRAVFPAAAYPALEGAIRKWCVLLDLIVFFSFFR
jgi:hypothetical protein